jgi:hypothetical protein
MRAVMTSSLARATLAMWMGITAVALSGQQPIEPPLAGSWDVAIDAFGPAKIRATGTLEVKAGVDGNVSVTLTVGSLKETVPDARVGRDGVELIMPDHYFTGVVSDQELASRLGIAVGTLVGTYVYSPNGKGDYKTGWRATRRIN